MLKTKHDKPKYVSPEDDDKDQAEELSDEGAGLGEKISNLAL